MPFVSRMTIVQWLRPRRGLYRGTVFLAALRPDGRRQSVEVTIERGYEPAAKRDVWRVSVARIDDDFNRVPYTGFCPVPEDHLSLWQARLAVDKWQCRENGVEYPFDPVDGLRR